MSAYGKNVMMAIKRKNTRSELRRKRLEALRKRRTDKRMELWGSIMFISIYIGIFAYFGITVVLG